MDAEITVGTRVRYRGLGTLGTVQSVWEVEGAKSYVVTWRTGQTTTVPDGYLLPVTSGPQPVPEQVLMWVGCGLLILLGVAIPLVGSVAHFR